MSNIKKNIAYQTVYRVLTVITPLITSPWLSRALGAQKLGVFSATLAFVNYFLLIALLGVENYGNRSIAAAQGDAAKQQELFWNIYAAQVLSSLLAIALYTCALLFVPGERFVIVCLQGIWLVASLFNVSWYFFGTEQFRLTVTRSIIVKIITVLLIIIFVRTPDDLCKYVVIMAGDTLLSNLALWPFLRKTLRFRQPKWKLVKSHIKPMFILFIPILAMSVFHIVDKSMLDLLGTETESGLYYSADKVINIPLSVITALGVVLLPRVSSEYQKGNMDQVKSLLKKSTELTFFMTCAVGVGIAAIAREFIPVFFGAGFELCVQLVYWFVPVLFAKAIGSLIRNQYMIPARMDKYYSISVAIGACVNIVANYFLISWCGALGAVLGTLIAEWTVTILQLWYTRRQIPFLQFIISSMCYVIPSTLMIVSVRIAAHLLNTADYIKIIAGIGIGGIVYMGSSLLVWKLKKDTIFRDLSIRDFCKWKQT